MRGSNKGKGQGVPGTSSIEHAADCVGLGAIDEHQIAVAVSDEELALARAFAVDAAIISLLRPAI